MFGNNMTITNLIPNQPYTDDKNIYVNYKPCSNIMVTPGHGTAVYTVHPVNQRNVNDFNTAVYKHNDTIGQSDNMVLSIENAQQKIYYNDIHNNQNCQLIASKITTIAQPIIPIEYKQSIQTVPVQDDGSIKNSIYREIKSDNAIVANNANSQLYLCDKKTGLNDTVNTVQFIQIGVPQKSEPLVISEEPSPVTVNTPVTVVHKPATKKRSRKQKPPKKVIKKRDRNPDRWMRNVRKKLKNLGQEYISSSGKKIDKKQVKPPCGNKCRIKCTSKINEGQRQELFDDFWNLGDVTKQRDYIVDLVGIIKPKYRYAKEASKRSFNFSFHFNVKKRNSAQEDRVRVCKTFFTATLDIGDTMMRTAIRKFNQDKNTADKRGKHANHRKVDQSMIESMKEHIENWLPRIQSNYMRREDQITIPKLYKDYVEQCERNDVKFGKLHMYRNVFHTDFKHYVHWFFPVFKNHCRVCHIFDSLSSDERRILMMEFSRHAVEGHWTQDEKQTEDLSK